MTGHHVESTRHEGSEAALMRELGEAKRQTDLAEALSESYRSRVQSFESQWTALTQERDAALAERDSLQADRKGLARALDGALAERDRLRDDLHGAARDWYDLRTAAHAFLALLDRHQFSSVALRGPELDALREACGE